MNSIQLRHDPDDFRQASRVSAFTGVMLFWAVLFVVIYIYLGGMQCAVVLLSGCVIALCNLVFLQQGLPARLCGNVLCAAAFFVYTGLSYFCGGRWAPSILWYVTIPVISFVVCGARWAAVWTSLSLLAILFFTFLEFRGIRLPVVITESQLVLMHNLGLLGLVICFYVLAYVMTRFERHSREVLREANRWLQLESSSDPLTRIANRRCFDNVFEQEWKRHRREKLPLTIALIDLDFFKEFNDLRGHLAGDNVLRLIARAIQAGVHRRDDVVARFGGEEFVVILPNTGENHVPIIIESIRERVRSLNIEHPKSSVSPYVTISIGTATAIPTDDRAHSDLLRQADEALYGAKSAGRNRVVHSTENANDELPDTVELTFESSLSAVRGDNDLPQQPLNSVAG